MRLDVHNACQVKDDIFWQGFVVHGVIEYAKSGQDASHELKCVSSVSFAPSTSCFCQVIRNDPDVRVLRVNDAADEFDDVAAQFDRIR